ncbi:MULTISPECIES: rod shape-determining protein RodA [Sphingomonadales]|uniref:Peptidoglycan glycosyltransferase MrdB n=2 Tax=Edaphosphingomonas TaxID=3423724 RepID=A0A2T4HPV7_9SPHN|nr:MULTISPECIES: rod shape-determining protein RodA [Sphingomonas]AGH50228.1 rod shape-determining protein RodA [Sphingomonas sp. MM-1]OHT18518.1 Rod shape-determining protein RodA [Sphingomonas haloaromaticamans]PTD17808.1 rod shape-determining protein RodA [Sphingomonas fennica]
MRDPLVPAPLAMLPWRLIATVIAIGGFGLVVLYSAAGGSLKPWALSQGIRFCAFLFGAILLSRVREDQIKAAAFPAYAIIVAALVIVEIFGFVGGGSQRWLDLGFIRLQPSELMKPAIVLVLARFYDLLPAGEIRRFSAIWPAAALIGVPFALVLVQPDLGTATMILAGGVVVTFLAGLPLRLYIGAGAAFLAALPIIFFSLHEYQRNRVLIFLDPESDPLGTGYHISQSKIAIGSGGIFGKGFLNGTQSHLDYLPEGHTDFVFATMAEEWGLAGGLFIIVAFLLVVNWGVRVALRARSRFGRLAAGGLSMTIFFYVAINLSMVMGLAPVVGIPLPLVSFGGSAVMTVMLCLGLLMAIDRAEKAGR